MDWSELLYNALNAVLVVVVPALAAYVAAWLKAKIEDFGRLRKEQENWWLDAALQTAVFAAEQLYKTGDGEAKLQYAYNYLVSWLDEKNIHIDADRIRGLIEAEVYKQFQRKQEG